jgi:hypothetical protein
VGLGVFPIASVFINGSLTSKFKMGRSLRQGNPLSLFLFLIAVERNVMLNASVEVCLYMGYMVCVSNQHLVGGLLVPQRIDKIIEKSL